jgi:hypothetical protein
MNIHHNEQEPKHDVPNDQAPPAASTDFLRRSTALVGKIFPPPPQNQRRRCHAIVMALLMAANARFQSSRQQMLAGALEDLSELDDGDLRLQIIELVETELNRDCTPDTQAASGEAIIPSVNPLPLTEG